MTGQPSKKSGQGTGEWFSFPGYLTLQSDKSPQECLLALRERQGASTLFGGYVIRVVLPKNMPSEPPLHFGIEYYHRHQKNGRATYVTQRLRGVLYTENGQTHLDAKVVFTSKAMLYVWLALLLTMVPFILALVTGNVLMLMMLMLPAPFLVAMIAVLYLDRFWFRRYVRRSITR
jgi:hypothetical protein